MAKGQYKCGKCGRKFSMPAHLARHLNAGHGAGGGSRSISSMRRGSGRPMTSVPFTAANLGGIRRQIEATLRGLSAQRDELDSQIAQISGALSALGGSGIASAGTQRRGAVRRGRLSGAGRPGRPGRRSRGGGGRRTEGNSLRDYVLKVLKQASSPMSVKDLSGAVKRAGYETASKDLSKAISNLIPKVSEIKRVNRGRYKAA